MTEKRFGAVRFIQGKDNGKYPYCHSIYIEGAGVLIDPACNRKRLIQLKETEGVNMVWLSHWHEDHITDLDLFDDLPLWTSEADAVPLSDIELFLDAYDMTGEFRDVWRTTMEEQFHFKPRKPDRFLNDGDIINLGPVTVEVIATPGHTPGHLSFFFKESKALFLGDYDLTRFGPWYGDRDSDIDDVIRSVEKLRSIPALVWMAGHETGLFEKNPGDVWNHYLNVIHRREKKLRELLVTPQTMSQIADAGIVYNRPGTKEDFFLFGEKAIMKKHVDRNIANGVVRKNGDGYVLTAA